MKKKLSFVALFAAVAALAIAASPASPGRGTAPAASATAATNATPAIDRGGVYYGRDDVARYIHAYGTLPTNFITKAQARALGWQGGPLEPYAPGKSIGGDRFGNYEGVLPRGAYRECDIDTLRRPRGAKRIVFSKDRRIYYSEDHYRTFERLY